MWRGGWEPQVTPQRDCLPIPGEMHEPHRAVTSTMSGEGKHFRFKQTQKQELRTRGACCQPQAAELGKWSVLGAVYGVL